MQKYFDSVISSDGRPVAGASVTVRPVGGGSPSALFSDSAGTVPVANPLTTDVNGFFEFYAADGRYTIEIAVSGYTTRTVTDILLEDPADANQQTINGGSINNTPIGANTPSSGAFTSLAVDANSASTALRITQTGSGNAFVVEDSASPDATPFVVDANGNVAIGAAAPDGSGLTIARGGNFTLTLRGDDFVTARFQSYRESPSDHGQITSLSARGTQAAPTVLLSGDRAFSIKSQGWTGSAWGTAAEIFSVADETHASGSTPGRLVFHTTPNGSVSSVERMRIDSSGNAQIGTTTIANTRLGVRGATSDNTQNALLCKNSGDFDLLQVRNDGHITTGTRTLSPYNNTTASAANMFVDANGVLFRSTSSAKYKTDIVDTTHGLAEVMALRSVVYKGKNDGDRVFGGFIAEEVHDAGLTEFVEYADDGTPDALAYGHMVSLLAKAIQQQQAMITELSARLAALEAGN